MPNYNKNIKKKLEEKCKKCDYKNENYLGFRYSIIILRGKPNAKK